MDAVLSLQPGASFAGRYRVVRRIKAGGMGAVYEVVDDRTDSPRALKVMLPTMLADRDMRARFALEAKVTGNIQSDHLVRVSDAGIDEPTETPFLVMELLHGQELGSLVSERGALPPVEVVLYLNQTALALDKTHAAGIVHRDLKPDNLFVTYRDDGTPCIKILDFGIAKVVAQSTARTTRAVGTPIYMAPEQVRGEPTIGPRTDLFALGQIAYTLLTGEAYWWEEMKASDSVFPLLSKIVAGLPEVPVARAVRRRGVQLPPAFDAWLAKAVAGKPEDRFDGATAQIAALAEALGVGSARAPVASVGAAAPAVTQVSTPPRGESGGGLITPAGTALLPPPAPKSAEEPPAAMPSSPVSQAGGSGPQPGASVVTAAPAPPRASPLVALAAGAAVLVVLGAGGALALRLRAPPSPPAAGTVATQPAPLAPPSPSPSVEPSAIPAASTAPPLPEPTATASAATKSAANKGAPRPGPPTTPKPPSALPRFTSPL